jgi:predicted nucleic acid-binding protein
MNFALDTNIVSFALRQQNGVKEMMYEAVSRGDILIIPPVTYFEIIRGLIADNAEVKLRLFYKMCENFSYIELEKADWLEATRLYADCRKRGRPTSDADILQAAFCLRHDCTLITNNTTDFDHFAGLQIIDWKAGNPEI